MNIEKYELTKKNKYNVYLSSGEVLTLDERVITSNELLLKKGMDKELYDKIINENKVYEMMDAAIKYIGVRLRSIKEIKDYLKKKYEEENLIEVATNKLISLGYLDDNKFAKAFIKDKLKFTSMGDYKIKMELEHLGVSSEIIEENISNIDESMLEEKIKKQIDKMIRTNKKHTGQLLKNKIYTHLVSAGFTKEKAIRILSTYDF